MTHTVLIRLQEEELAIQVEDGKLYAEVAISFGFHSLVDSSNYSPSNLPMRS